MTAKMITPSSPDTAVPAISLDRTICDSGRCFYTGQLEPGYPTLMYDLATGEPVGSVAIRVYPDGSKSILTAHGESDIALARQAEAAKVAA